MLKLISKAFKPKEESQNNNSDILTQIQEHRLVIKSLELCKQDSTTRMEIKKEQGFIQNLESKL